MSGRSKYKISRKWRAWKSRAVADRRLILEAALWLGFARAVICLFPFRWIAAWIRRRPATLKTQTVQVLAIGEAIGVAARHVPWRAVCLQQAVTAKVMLNRRGLSSEFHLGVQLDDKGAIMAHAWLTSDGKVVTGGDGLQGITPLLRLG